MNALLILFRKLVDRGLLQSTRAVVSCLAIAALAFVPGCDEVSNSAQPASQQSAQAGPDPVGDFEWGIERLERALRVFRPRGGDGVAVTERKVEHELFPPHDTVDHYTARIVVTSETAFIHGQRAMEEKLQSQEKQEQSLQEDVEALLDRKDDESAKMIDLKNVGPQAPDAPAADVDTRSVDNRTVFELAFLDGRWKLTNEPKFEYEKEWFKYAFE